MLLRVLSCWALSVVLTWYLLVNKTVWFISTIENARSMKQWQVFFSRWYYFKSLLSISQILDTKLTSKIRVMKMLGKWNQKSRLLTELWIKLSTVKKFNSVAVKPKNSQTWYKRRNIQIFQNSEHLIERTASSFFERPLFLKSFLSFVHVMTCHGSCQH